MMVTSMKLRTGEMPGTGVTLAWLALPPTSDRVMVWTQTNLNLQAGVNLDMALRREKITESLLAI
jgi:hypothetical protein